MTYCLEGRSRSESFFEALDFNRFTKSENLIFSSKMQKVLTALLMAEARDDRGDFKNEIYYRGYLSGF